VWWRSCIMCKALQLLQEGFKISVWISLFTPLLLKLVRWRWAIGFMTQTLCIRGKSSRYPAVRVSGAVWALSGRDKSLASSRNWTTIARSSASWPRGYTDCAIPSLFGTFLDTKKVKTGGRVLLRSGKAFWKNFSGSYMKWRSCEQRILLNAC
jgi:hypothetical protein